MTYPTPHRTLAPSPGLASITSLPALHGERARDWLLSQCDALHRTQLSEQTTRAHLQALLGLWLCREGLQVPVPTLLTAARALQQSLDAAPDSRAWRYLLTCDAVHVLLVVGVLEALHTPSRNLTDFAHQLARIVDQSREQAGLQHLLLQRLLHRLGLGLGGTTWPDSVRVASDSPLVLADRACMEQVVQLAALSRIGAPMPQNLAPQLDWALPVWLTDALHQYDLTLGAAVLRAMRDTGRHTRSVAIAGVRFLLEQQALTGAFGMYGPDIIHLEEQRPDCDPVLELELPTTLACLHTLAEQAPTAVHDGERFSLYRSVGSEN